RPQRVALAAGLERLLRQEAAEQRGAGPLSGGERLLPRRLHCADQAAELHRDLAQELVDRAVDPRLEALDDRAHLLDDAAQAEQAREERQDQRDRLAERV